jgi:L-serine dehydratase
LKPVPYPFSSADELLHIGHEHARTIWQIALENEKAWRSEEEIRAYVRSIMQHSVQRGLRTEGILPGGLNVRRRAPRLAKKLADGGSSDPLAAMDWVNVFAMAVNEENASGGRFVTAPTNGAAGVIPAVAHYYLRFVPQASDEGLLRFFLTAAAIGILIIRRTPPADDLGACQGDIGVEESSPMKRD